VQKNVVKPRQRVRELAQARVRFGYRRIYMMLKREGWDLGKDKLYAFITKKAWVCDVSGRGVT
jgi:transposase InsO family protein